MNNFLKFATAVLLVCLYVCRSEVTPKAAFKYINELNAQNKFKKIAVVVNDIDFKKRKSRYGYGYGYSYGYEDEKDNNKKRKFLKRVTKKLFLLRKN